jgi:hypothetical protein
MYGNVERITPTFELITLFLSFLFIFWVIGGTYDTVCSVILSEIFT